MNNQQPTHRGHNPHTETMSSKISHDSLHLSFFMCLMILTTLPSCNQKRDNTDTATNETALPVLNLAAQIEANVLDTFTWNSIQKKVTFIPLETTEASMIGHLSLSYIDDGVILIGDAKTYNILLFNIKGKCISHFNHQGNGPGEYFSINGLFFNPSDSTINVYDRQYENWITYTSTGKPLSSISTKKLFKGGVAYCKGNQIITSNSSGKTRLSLFDQDFTLIKGVLPLDSTQSHQAYRPINFFSSTTWTKDIMLFTNTVETDTIWACTSDVKPFFIVEKGKYVIPESERSDYFKAFLELNPTYPKDFHFDAFSHFVLMKYLYKGLIVAELWNLPSGKILSRCSLQNVVTKEVFSDGFAYTLPSGNVIHALPAYVTESKLVFVLSPEDLMDEIPGLKEDDNPVLMVINLN